MFLRIFSVVLTMLIVGSCLYAQTAAPVNPSGPTPPQGMRGTPVNLPDISVVGVLSGYVSDDKSDGERNQFVVDEIETAFQGYIYPEMRADVFLALHRHEGEVEAEICEAKVGFLNLAPGVAGEVGKIHVNFGKLNKVHTHTRPVIDQPTVLTNFFGEHGLIGQGGTLSYLLPVPFFLQIEGGAWRADPHHHHTEYETVEVPDGSGGTVEVLKEKAHEDTEYSFGDEFYTARAKTSFALLSKSEIEIGSSFAHGKGAHFEEHKDVATVVGADLTFRLWPDAYRRWTFQNEWLRLKRRGPVGTLTRDGFYSFLSYRLNKHVDFGGRWDYAENAFPTKIIERAISGILSYHLTETSALRVQYKRRRGVGETINEGWTQLVFGLGPHSHELD
ncbi:MAG: hypothetical protein LHV69_02265 [Elusimicrobia bacterium]|nr:hypothetical protein [Candidatus Obscuribacterium magneticum]MCB4755851.1 hypothetical protein [Candidatus Obscuribacterium magneticum]